MSDLDRLVAVLNGAARPPKPKQRAIVCYDRAWAGLPRITAYDPPSRRKAGGRKRARRVVASRPVKRRSRQMELPL